MRSYARVATAVVALTLSMSGILAAQAAAPKIVYVNSQKIIAQAPGRADAEAQFQKEMDQYKAQVQKMGDSLQTAIADYQKQQSTLTPAVKATREKDLRDRQAAYQQHVQQLEQTAQQREAELVRPIMEQINKIIEQIRTENSYSFILDAGSQAGVVVAADSSLDITDSVIKRLAAAGPVATKTSTPAPTTATPRPTGAATQKPTGVARPKTTP
ncbi:MAG TPA: OmpH family outer membrane protein [Gemmatimonadaceae bacterium]|jgi:outer membrane protein|nr:OmpH family outer membrane protein [Gemmatimonadaceae bacterium]